MIWCFAEQTCKGVSALTGYVWSRLEILHKDGQIAYDGFIRREVGWRRDIGDSGSDVISELDLFAVGLARADSDGITAQRGQCEGREAVLGKHIDLGYDDNLVGVWVNRRKVIEGVALYDFWQDLAAT